MILLLILTVNSCDKIDSPILGKWQYIVDIGLIHTETERIMTFRSDGTATFGIADDLTHYNLKLMVMN